MLHQMLCTLDPTLSVELHQTLAHEVFAQLSHERHRLMVYRLDKQQAARRSTAIHSHQDPVFEPWDVERYELTERLRMAHEEAQAAGKLGMGRALQGADFAVCARIKPETLHCVCLSVFVNLAFTYARARTGPTLFENLCTVERYEDT